MNKFVFSIMLLLNNPMAMERGNKRINNDYTSVILVISGGQLKRMGRATVPNPRETYI